MRPETARALGALLLYPTPELLDALPRIEAILRADRDLPPERLEALGELLRELADRDLLDLEEAYTGLFDRGTSLSLHLFEHVHGEGRERGQAMVELIGLYRRHGLTLETRELPDHLTVICEFLSIAPAAAAAEMLADISGILALLARRLTQRGSRYAEVLQALCDLAGGAAVEPESPETRDPVEDPEQELLEIDHAWEDAPITFGAQDPATLGRDSR
ncbi:MAG: nitrate reductase molybdenum cofactor assembly chaperone [Myxococcota bacterium]|nr:nitrate reductase molybdenum cofactor assembly chaperone [Myxococcota bacterium]